MKKGSSSGRMAVVAAIKPERSRPHALRRDRLSQTMRPGKCHRRGARRRSGSEIIEDGRENRRNSRQDNPKIAHAKPLKGPCNDRARCRRKQKNVMHAGSRYGLKRSRWRGRRRAPIRDCLTAIVQNIELSIDHARPKPGAVMARLDLLRYLTDAWATARQDVTPDA